MTDALKAVRRAVSGLLDDHGQVAARPLLREAIIRVGLNEGLASALAYTRAVIAEMESELPL